MYYLNEKRLLYYPIKDIFNLVLDIESYPQFLPWLKDATIISKSSNNIIADLTIHFASVTQSYRSNVVFHLDDDKGYIEAVSQEGPFKHLFSKWTFVKENENTMIEFILEFELKFKIMTNLLGPVIMSAQKKMINAFEKRAEMHLKQ